MRPVPGVLAQELVTSRAVSVTPMVQ